MAAFRGLRNVSSTCYMLARLQSLFGIPSFKNAIQTLAVTRELEVGLKKNKEKNIEVAGAAKTLLEAELGYRQDTEATASIFKGMKKELRRSQKPAFDGGFEIAAIKAASC